MEEQIVPKMKDVRITIRPVQVSNFPPAWGLEETPDPQGRYVRTLHYQQTFRAYVDAMERNKAHLEMVRQLEAKVKLLRQKQQEQQEALDAMAKENRKLKQMLNI